jgi:hypothetical protein
MTSWSTIPAAVLAIAAGLMVTAAAHSGEHVTVKKVMKEQVVVSRSSGATYRLNTAAGCMSLWRYEGKQVVVTSPVTFAGAGSKVVIPDVNQECRVWSSARIAD